MDTALSILATTILALASLWIYAVRKLNAAHLRSLDKPGHPPPVDLPLSAAYEAELTRLLAQMDASGPFKARLTQVREKLDEFGRKRGEGEFRPFEAQGLLGEWVIPPKRQPDLRMLYLHGGGFAVGSAISHRPITAELARLTGAAVLALNYRLMPEHSREAQLDDCRNAYQWLLENGPDGTGKAGHLVLAGDSAGGHLALMLAIWCRDTAVLQPDRLITFAPATDAGLCSPSFRANVRKDRFLGPALAPLARIPRPLLFYVNWLLFKVRPTYPAMSPLRNDLSGLPPMLVQASSDEMLYDDSVRLVNKVRASGGRAELQHWTRRCHVFQILGSDVPEAAEALALAAEFAVAGAPNMTTG